MASSDNMNQTVTLEILKNKGRLLEDSDIKAASKVTSKITMAAELTAELDKNLRRSVVDDIHQNVMAAVRMKKNIVYLNYSKDQVEVYLDNLRREGFTRPAFVTTLAAVKHNWNNDYFSCNKDYNYYN